MATAESIANAPLTYEAARARIRECVRLLSAGELELDSMIALFEEACRLTEQVERQLQSARLRVTEISERYLATSEGGRQAGRERRWPRRGRITERRSTTAAAEGASRGTAGTVQA